MKAEVEKNIPIHYPTGRDVLQWAKDNPALIPHKTRGRSPTRLIGFWGGNGSTMHRDIKVFSPRQQKTAPFITVGEKAEGETNVFNLKRLPVAAEVTMGNPDKDKFGERFSLAQDGENTVWYRQEGIVERSENGSVDWQPRGANRRVTDIVDVRHIEDVIRRRGGAYDQEAVRLNPDSNIRPLRPLLGGGKG